MAALKQVVKDVTYIGDVPVVPWFPRKLQDLDLIGKTTTLKAGEGKFAAMSEHPSFTDKVYR